MVIIKDRIELLDKYWDMIKIVFTEMQFHEELKEVFITHIVSRGKDVVENFIKAGVNKGIFREIDTTIALRSLIGIVGIYAIQNQVIPGIIEMDRDIQISIQLQ